jgi:hypothetical protein
LLPYYVSLRPHTHYLPSSTLRYYSPLLFFHISFMPCPYNLCSVSFIQLFHYSKLCCCMHLLIASSHPQFRNSSHMCFPFSI